MVTSNNPFVNAEPPADAASASRTLESLQAQLASARAELSHLRGELAKGREALKSLHAERMHEVDAQLVRAAAHADTVAQFAVSSLGELTHFSQHDELTGAPNRALLLDRLETAIASAARRTTRVGLLFVDLDHFKQINDSLGHAVGDQVLQLVARRLQSSVRESDTVSRHGGDEFLVLLGEISHASDAAAVAQKMLAALALPARIGSHTLRLSASVGIAVYPEDGVDAGSLIECADASMYRSKRRAPGGSAFTTAADAAATGDSDVRIVAASLERRRPDSPFAQHEMRLRELSKANHELLEAARVAQGQRATAEEAHRRQIDFVAKAAHAMRTPLSVILLTAKTLARTALAGHKAPETMQRQVSLLARLIDDLLDGSIVGGGEFRLARSTVDLDAVVAAAVDACRHGLDAKRQRLHVQPAPERPMLDGDPMRLTQLFSNLLVNASRRAPEGGNVWLTTTAGGAEAAVVVADDGAAISPEAAARLFDLFALDAHHTSGDPGLGIGLAVARELAKAHGGSVEARNPIDRPGGEFVVTLPMLPDPSTRAKP